MTAKSNAPHNPLHIYTDNVFYFVTGTILHHAHLLAPTLYKQHLQEQLLDLASQYGLDMKAWVILDNHYHLLFSLANGENLTRFIKRLHSKTATTFNQADRQPGRQVWWNYWDWCIRNERDYWQHFNYIHYNPLKHGYVQQLREWPHSSLFTYLVAEGKEWLDDCWRSYPIKEFQVDNDDDF
jgi:putative transposase